MRMATSSKQQRCIGVLKLVKKIIEIWMPKVHICSIDIEAFSQKTWSGKENIAKLLIENGANVNAKRGDGYTPLHYATEFGNFIFVWILLETYSFKKLKKILIIYK